MISSTGTCGWRRCRTSPQGNRRPRRNLNKHSDFLNKHLRLSKYEDIKIWGWWRFKKFSPNLHCPSSRSQYCNTGINICLEILLFSFTHFWSRTDNLVKPNTTWNNKHLFHSWAVSRLKAAISLQNLALSITKRWRSILLIIKYINNVFISWWKVVGWNLLKLSLITAGAGIHTYSISEEQYYRNIYGLYIQFKTFWVLPWYVKFLKIHHLGQLCATVLCLMMTAVSSSYDDQSITPSLRFLHTYPESSWKFLTHPTHTGQEGFSLTFYLLPCGLLIPLTFTLHFALYAADCTISDFFNMTPKYFLKVLKAHWPLTFYLLPFGLLIPLPFTATWAPKHHRWNQKYDSE